MEQKKMNEMISVVIPAYNREDITDDGFFSR